MNCAFTISKYLFSYFLMPFTILCALAFLGFNFLRADNALLYGFGIVNILLLILIPGLAFAKLLRISPAETSIGILVSNLFLLYITFIHHTNPIFLLIGLLITYIPAFKMLGDEILQLGISLSNLPLLQRAFHKLPLLQNHYQKDRNAKNYTLNDIDAMDGEQFEHYVANLLALYQFTNIKVSPYSQDQGLDVYAEHQTIKYGFQCKRWGKNVPLSAIQEIYTAKELYQIDRAIVITNSGFTRAAINAALKLDVMLIDRNRLDEMIRNLQHPERGTLF